MIESTRNGVHRAQTVRGICDWCGVERTHKTTDGNDADMSPMDILVKVYNWIETTSNNIVRQFCSRKCGHALANAGEPWVSK